MEESRRLALIEKWLDNSISEATREELRKLIEKSPEIKKDLYMHKEASDILSETETEAFRLWIYQTLANNKKRGSGEVEHGNKKK